MKRSPISRRDFVKTAAFTAAAVPVATSLLKSAGEPASVTPGAAGIKGGPADGKLAEIRWLEGRPPTVPGGVTWGVPWPQGQYRKGTGFVVRNAGAGAAVPSQNWPLAYWPDGSLKWTAHAVASDAALGSELEVTAGTPAAPSVPVKVLEGPETIEVDTGVIVARVPRRGPVLVASIERDGKRVLQNGRLVALCSDRPDMGEGAVRTDAFHGEISAATVEQVGPVRAVVKLEGRHSGGGRSWLPFTIRLYFYAGAESVRIMHSFVFDGDENKDFISGLGVRFEVPMQDELHDRHVRFVGEDGGLWGEAVRGLTGLRRDPDGRNWRDGPIKRAQVAGEACPPLDAFDPRARERLQYVPAWGDYTLLQPAAGSFLIRKRTKPGHGWIDVDQGTHAAGVGYIGGAKNGGVVFGLRDFWQRHPTQLDVRGANGDAAEVTLWMWSPEAKPMDLRFYHDGMGMDTYEKQYNGGLDITYEDYEPGWGSAHGIARSSEIMLWAMPATPPRARIVEMADAVRGPVVAVCTPEHFLATGVFGGLWSLPDRSTPAKAAIEDRLDWQIGFYRHQVEQRHWYGFWNYGDVMHTYDGDRHVWRYDVGGFAWDNSELSPDLWLWFYFLRTGRSDVFRFAEAMTRHTGEVDVYHAGRFAGLGSRHNVQHWGCSAKQVRISTAAYRRFYYYLTADERVGDLMRELLDVDVKLDAVDPARKLVNSSPKGDYDARVSFGTDWANLAVAWLTEWERGGDPKYRDKLLRGVRDFGNMPLGFFTSDRYGYRAATGSIEALAVRGKAGGSSDPIGVSHLDSVFGAVETFAEIIQLVGSDPEYAPFERAWLQYCTFYSASPAEQTAELGAPVRGNSLTQAHARLTAYAAWKKKDPALAKRAWSEFAKEWMRPTLETTPIKGPDVLNPVDEARWVSTNDASQWGLAAMQCLALAGDELPSS